MDEKYDIVKQVSSRPTYNIRRFLGGLDTAHEFFTLKGMERQFIDRIEMKLNLGGFLTVALYPEIARLHLLLNRRGNDLVCVEFDTFINDTVVYCTTQRLHTIKGIGFQRVGKNLRVHISIMGQFTMILVNRKDFLNAIEELGGLAT